MASLPRLTARGLGAGRRLPEVGSQVLHWRQLLGFGST